MRNIMIPRGYFFSTASPSQLVSLPIGFHVGLLLAMLPFWTEAPCRNIGPLVRLNSSQHRYIGIVSLSDRQGIMAVFPDSNCLKYPDYLLLIARR